MSKPQGTFFGTLPSMFHIEILLMAFHLSSEIENIMSAWTKEGAFLGSLVNQLSDVASLPASLCRDDLAIQLLCLNWDDICALFSWILGFWKGKKATTMEDLILERSF